jgi:mannosyltransferase OCH1-like enzyme
LIPRIIHRVSFGDNLPRYVEEGWELSKNINNGWTHLTHNYDNVEEFPISAKYWDLSDSFSFKSDLIRLEALYNWGGFYIDTDVFMIKSFESLTSLNSVVLGNERDRLPIVFGSAIIASPAKNEYILEALNRFIEYAKEDAENPNLPDYCHLWRAFGPKVMTELVNNSPRNAVKKLSHEYFYPVPWNVNDKACPKIYKNESPAEYIQRVRKFIRGETYCVHAWALSWSSK